MSVSTLYQECKNIFEGFECEYDGEWRDDENLHGNTYSILLKDEKRMYFYKGKDDRHSHFGLCINVDRQAYVFADPTVYGHNQVVQGSSASAVMDWLKKIS